MQWLDWLLVVFPLAVLIGISLYAKRYMRSVADFLSGGRLAGRYLLSVAKGEMAVGAVCFVAGFEATVHSGFTLTWWSWVNFPVMLLVAVSGFVVYRYRETRCMTLAQFFELRYSKTFRIFTGILGFGAGVVNFGIVPAVSARFLTYFMGFPPEIELFAIKFPTYILLMATMLGLTVYLALSGGIITLMITSCVEGMFSNIFYLVIIFGLLAMFSWSDITQVLVDRPAGHSLVNPFDSFSLTDFNVWFVLMSMTVSIYGTMAWQNQSAFNSAAITAHESRMGNILGRWRELGKAAITPLLVICALTFLQHPSFTSASAAANAEISSIADARIQGQMQIPIALEYLLPMGIKGALCIVMLMGSLGGDGSHVHSWGSLLIQDIIVPLRKKPLTPEQHVSLLRWAIIGVAFFAFCFGICFRQTEYISMWWQVTMALYVGGAGAAIIGGLYWKKGTTAGAWSALISGSGLSTCGILARQMYGERFPLNGMEISFYASLIAIFLYIIVSWLTCRENFNMNRMLHRDADSLETKKAGAGKLSWGKLLGIDEHFTRGDKWVAGLVFAWGIAWFGVFAVGSIWNVISPWKTSTWLTFWHITAIGIPVVLAVVTTVWFIWGGAKDMWELFARLRTEKRNARDNGMVVNHQNLDESLSPRDERTASPESETMVR